MYQCRLLISAVAVLAPAVACAVPFTNGSFESATVNPGPSFTTLYASSTQITGWKVTTGSVDYVAGWAPADGQRSLDLNGLSIGSITQTFDTTSGERYGVTFSLAGNPDRTTPCCGGAANSPIVKTLTVSAGGQSASYSFDVTGLTTTSMGWTDRLFEFVAVSPSTTLSFSSTTSDCCWGPALDNVRVMSLTAVPESPTASLFGIALLGLVGVRRILQKGP